jgi:A/G-specific adenine glycosylase
MLGWYDRAARRLPWRVAPGQQADPYHVWLSEIMLQQTTVKAVIPYYQRFLARWPSITELAAADLNDVLAAWAGLGYYSRARNLHACAKVVATTHGGHFPDTEEALSALPGIGAYTAAAIAAIAFGRPAAVVDGNVERVVARLFAVETPLPAARREIRRLAAMLTPATRPGDFAQAMMDLGATLCSPRTQSCAHCPVAGLCMARMRGLAAQLPARSPKAERPQRYAAAFVAIRADGAVLLRRRPPKGLLGGMLEVPSTEWGNRMPDPRSARGQAPFAGRWQRLAGDISHTFTHFHLRLEVYRAERLALSQFGFFEPSGLTPAGCDWYARADLGSLALPSVMRKILAHAFAAD